MSDSLKEKIIKDGNIEDDRQSNIKIEQPIQEKSNDKQQKKNELLNKEDIAKIRKISSYDGMDENPLG